MKNPIHPKLDLPFAVADMLVLLAQSFAAAAAAELPRRKRPLRGGTLRPGPATPMWNALSSLARSQLKIHGEKARLGRVLGVPPQRVHEYLMAKSSMPDAERTLLFLHWVAQRKIGRDLG